MFNLFKRSKPLGTTITLHLSGLHCTSCALNIDGALEEIPGVLESKTSYARSLTTIIFDPNLVKPSTLQAVIEEAGYIVTQTD